MSLKHPFMLTATCIGCNHPADVYQWYNGIVIEVECFRPLCPQCGIKYCYQVSQHVPPSEVNDAVANKT